ncbi:Nrap protein [Lasiosphaeris hirsuta]|uniref:U3 small nucleolar RNA-associated protein 22 n=1 Tax=Lasiosphaeris hirsuta TaxID=260670 RepID=A0AA40E538_9PEZI|nr:Nrap protein [Lasiosphaeris hirsuta]
MDSGPAKRRKLGHSQTTTENAAQSVVPRGPSRLRAFIFEADELLGEVSLDYAVALRGADNLLHKVKGSIEAIEPHESLPINDAARQLEKKHRIHVPFPEPRPAKDSNYKVSFAKPSQFNVVGSYVSKTMVKSQKDHAVDMVVVIPAEILQEKDHYDLRYFYKRAYFLAVISAGLQKDFKDIADLSFEHLNGNPLCPVVTIRPKKDGAEKEGETSEFLDYRIRVIPCVPDGFFPRTKLHLEAALIRKGHGEGDLEPSPFYNSTLTAEGSFLAYLRVLKQAEKKCAAFNKACILGRIWLQQRGFGGDISKGGFGHFEWAVLLALLLQGGESKGNGTLSTSLSGTQLFKALIQFLSVTNLAEKPCVLGPGKADFEAPEDCGPVIYDSSRQHNIAFKMSPWSAALLLQQAKWTRSLLSDNAVDQFGPSFILKTDLPLHSFDLVARLNHSGTFDKVSETDPRGRPQQLGEAVYKILKRAFSDEEYGDKAQLIHIQTPDRPAWSLAESTSPLANSGLQVAILFHPVNMARTVDRGPSAGPSAEEKEECDAFRQFWGDKAELRRFERDGIHETLIWNSSSPFELCEEIIRYVLNLHLRIGAVEKDLTFYGNGLSSLLSFKPTDLVVFNAARKAFASFERDVRDLEDLPLHVRQLAPICPELRQASVKLPTIGWSKSGPQPMETVISFEASGKWPESIAAIQRTKIAFLLMIGSLLEKSKAGELKTWLGLEDSTCDTENLAFLDVIYESGASFRLRIHSDLEETLLEREAKDKTSEQYLRTKSATSLATFRRLYTQLPLHTQTISTFVTRFPALSPTIRLLKHWFNSHKLSCHFTEEFIELVVLHVFICPYPWEAPSSDSTGFYRALLFLARWGWRSDPLILDTGGDMAAAERHAIGTRMEAWRKIDPNMNHTVLFVATAQDPSGLAYTALDGHAKPSKVVASRMTALAKSASKVIREQGVELDPRRLFVPSVKDYDVLFHLNGKLCKSLLKMYPTDDLEIGNEGAVKHSKFKNLDEQTGQNPLPLAQHPADALLKQLNAAYSGPLVFFRGAAEDKTIGAIWNPQMQQRSFRVNLPTSYKPVARVKGGGSDNDDDDKEEEQVVDVNREAIVAEIARIGGDLVEKIDVKGL